MRTFWLSWYEAGTGAFTLYWPWWISGWREAPGGDYDQATVVAAVRATSEDEAQEAVLSSYDVRPKLEWRFVEEITDPAWSPYSDRFPQAKWMRWPVAATP